MMKSFILAATSIVYIFSIASIADAKVKLNINKSTDRSQASSTEKQQQSNFRIISKSDLDGIRQAITEYFAEENDLRNPTIDHSTRQYKTLRTPQCTLSAFSAANCSFYEVKSLKLISFTSIEAELESDVIITEYYFKKNSTPPIWSVEKRKMFLEGGSARIKPMITVRKVNDRWRLHTFAGTALTYK